LAPNNAGAEHPTAQPDPLNPRIASQGEESILALPGAPDDSWYRRTPNVRGRVERHSLESKLLAVRRDISVYTPPGYSPSLGPYPLIILFDGDVYETLPAARDEDEFWAPGAGATNTVDNLIAARQMRPAVVCFVSDNRDRFPAVSAEARIDVYAEAMATELVPTLRSLYALSTSRGDVVIGGYSAGGGAATHTAVRYPTLFGNLLLQSSGGGAATLASFERADPKQHLRVYFDPDSFRPYPWDPAEREKVIAAFNNSRTRPVEILRGKGYDVIVRDSGGVHDTSHWAATLAEALRTLLPPSR
jgi:enterochelin esterase family protein